MRIRLATPDDTGTITSILEPVIRAGETYTLDHAMTRAFDRPVHGFVDAYVMYRDL